jgi:hypothetical protein
MLRVYSNTTIPGMREILKSGFRDVHSFGDAKGVYVGRKPLDANDGFSGDIVLCLNIPDDIFEENEEIECPEDSPERRTGRSLIPAEILNQYGPAQVYSHAFSGCSRRDLLHLISHSDGPRATELQDAFDLFEEIGWMTPVSVKESGSLSPDS